MTIPKDFAAQAREIVERYPHLRSALMPLLYLAQSLEGHVSREGMQAVASALGLTTAEIEAVVTFYTMYRRPGCGRYLVSICTNLSCALRGGRRLMELVLEELGPEALEATADGAITVHEEECLAACDAAPVVQVNWLNYDRVSEDDLRHLLAALRDGTPPPPARGPVPGTLSAVSRVLAGLEEAVDQGDSTGG
ncbi:MAG TPA: NADH-quinone oxidoreductase subunit NuoE [Actinomycetota bacterium]|nr:NADH-quinone oxidoreductase subunit NuoE [Actinomycetota bacterium]